MNQVYDYASTMERLGHDRALLIEMAEFFAEDAPPLLEQLADASQSRDGDAARRAAHSLKSMTATFSAARATQAAALAERGAVAGDWRQLSAALVDLNQAVSELIQALHHVTRSH